MYLDYWNLKNLPFLDGTDDKLVYMTDQHREGLARLLFLANDGRMAGMITGALGVGKSLTLDLLAKNVRRNGVPVIRMDAIPGGTLPMAQFILDSLGLKEKMATTEEALMRLQVICQSGRNLHRHLILIDEAQYLEAGDGCYFAHYLCNLRIPESETSPEIPLFTLILAGTEKLRSIVDNYDSLRRRIQLDWVLAPLNRDQTLEYTQFRVRNSGGDAWLFSRDALEAIYRFSGGIPRSINHLCDTALMLGYASNSSEVSADIIAQAAQSTGLEQPK